METICNFKRVEKKYLLSEAQYDALLRRIGWHLRPDEFGRSTVMSLYLDTPDHRIIRSSMEAVDYKEKLRLRSYGTASADSTVFLELKKKFGGVVYKRRAAMSLSQAERYLRTGIRPFSSQIMSEIDRDIRCRESELRLDRGSAGMRLLPRDTVLLEIKTAGAMPLWLADALDAEGILPGSFSKYGAAYTRAGGTGASRSHDGRRMQTCRQSLARS